MEPSDWYGTHYYKDHSTLPPSCCSDLTDNQPCEVDSNNTYSDGCYTKTINFVLDNIIEVGLVALIIGLSLAGGVSLSLCFRSSISKARKKEEWKDMESDSAVEGHLPLKLQCVACLSKICPCLVQPPVPESL